MLPHSANLAWVLQHSVPQPSKPRGSARPRSAARRWWATATRRLIAPGAILLATGTCLFGGSAAGAPLLGVKSKPGVLEELDQHLPEILTSRALTLAGRTDVRASLLLLDLAQRKEATSDPVFRLMCVLALSEHLDGSKRVQVVRRLIDLFQTGPEPTAQARPDRHARARATAALVLAKSGHPEAIRVLVALAAKPLGEGELSPWSLAESSRRALRRFPPDVLRQRTDPTNVISESELSQARFFTFEQEARLRAERHRRIEALTPAQLIAGARQGELGTQLELIARSPAHLPRETRRKKSWLVPLQNSPEHALRVLTMLQASFADSLRLQFTSLIEKQAKQHIDHPRPEVRSAAAWSLAVVSPKDALPLLSSDDPVVVAAVMRQAHVVELSSRALEYASSGSIEALRPLALDAALLNPQLTARQSAQALRGWEKGSSSRTVEALSVRMSSTPVHSPVPRVSEVRAWLEDPDPEVRAAAARGLGRSKESSAIGLLSHAYAFEEESSVRRAIISSLYRLDKDSSWLKWARLYDPDPGCRAMAEGRPDPASRHTLLATGRSRVLSATSRLGVSYRGRADPDGFFAVVDGSR